MFVYLGSEDEWLFLRTMLGSGRQESSLEAAISKFGAGRAYTGAVNVGYYCGELMRMGLSDADKLYTLDRKVNARPSEGKFNFDKSIYTHIIDFPSSQFEACA